LDPKEKEMPLDPYEHERKIVFALFTASDGKPTLILGVPKLAWLYMKDGKTHHFDLSSIGIPLQLMLFGAKNSSQARQFIETGMKLRDQPFHADYDKDFAIQHPEGGTTDVDLLRGVLRDCHDHIIAKGDLKDPTTRQLLARAQKLLSS
jgi:hypothetical protein